MRKERKKRFRSHTNKLKLGIGRNLEGNKDFCEKKRGLDRERREKYQDIRV